MDNVLTMMAPGGLDKAMVRQAASRIEVLGGEAGAVTWLHPEQAVDLTFGGIGTDTARSAIREMTAGKPVDLIAQPVEARRKKLLIADMDSTIVTGETLDELADFLGFGHAVAAITTRAMNGELDFAEALRARVAMLEGQSAHALQAILRTKVTLMPGAKALVQTMKAHGAHTVLCSGGFTAFTAPVAAWCGFHDHQGNVLESKGGTLTGLVKEPVLGQQAKLDRLIAEAARLKIALAAAVTVGDGANDIPMLEAAGLGVAYRGKPAVRAAVTHRLDHMDLTGLLYAQGYTAQEITAAG